ncbi:hypothetical protein [Paenibacillus sp. FSL R7-0337]|uniref:hypothetical protein n=1 Tax=Paenibacillus sp. FSL R7-0337 TaxID=1926588 RepID=UPI00096C5BF3|nr:hypothetical protein [Paenibacillus sp. FSL R7-0337]OMF90433.1 hypothetical protein BK147_23925 [Paenibacillus sp. FSL R7-0337]
MKRTACIVLTLVVLLGNIPEITSAKAGPTQSWTTLYSEYIKKALMDDTREWDSNEDYFTLVDLNRDGIPELIQGSSYRTVDCVNFAITVQNGNVVNFNYQGKLENSSEGIFNVGMGAFFPRDEFRGLQLYKNKMNGKYIYIGFGGGSSAIAAYPQVFEINFNGTKFSEKEIFSAILPDPDEVDVKESYSVNKKEVSKSVYDKAYKQYFSNLTKVPSKVISASYNDLYSYEDQKLVSNGVANFLKRFKN